MSKLLVAVLVPVLAALVGAGVQVSRPLPAAQIQTAPGELKLPGAFAVSFPARGQSAVGEVSLGVVAQTPNQEPVAIASLTKMMTAYMLLQAKPLKVGEDGPTSTITAADVAEYKKDLAAGYSILKVTVGEKLTERQMLEALLLPSADNIATKIAQELAGSEANFVKKMNETARALGMTQTTYADSHGVNNATVSTASDQLLIAREAMKNRVFRDIVRMPQALMPVGGVVYNVNFMVGKQGISGIKTGSTLAAGSCFVGSYPVTVNGKPRILLAAVLGQVSLRNAVGDNAKILRAIAPQFKDYPVAPPGGGFAKLTTPWREPVKLALAKPLNVFGYPGMPMTLSAKLTQTAFPITAGQAAGTLDVTAGGSTETLSLLAAEAVHPPEIRWRLSRWQ